MLKNKQCYVYLPLSLSGICGIKKKKKNLVVFQILLKFIFFETKFY